MMRVIESGGKVKMVKTLGLSFGVDTEADLQYVEKKMIGDPLMAKYR